MTPKLVIKYNPFGLHYVTEGDKQCRFIYLIQIYGFYLNRQRKVQKKSHKNEK